MKHTILICTALLSTIFTSTAQQSGRIRHTEAIPYHTRHDAETRNRAASGHTIDFRPALLVEAGPVSVMGQQVDIPYIWRDGVVFLHLENPGSAYSLRVNDRLVADVEDAATPADFELTDCLHEGVNDIKILLRESRTPQIDIPTIAPRETFAESYLYYQNKRSIADFQIALVPDTLGRDFAMLDLKIIARNAFNYDETVEVGYDIYSPQGKLLEFNMREVTIPGRSTDTVHFTPFIYHAFENKWEPSGKNPPLYKVMLFTRRQGAYKEYMPLRLGFGKTELVNGRLMRSGKELKLRTKSYNAAINARATSAELQALRKEGYNTLTPDYPQPGWFYDLCDSLGLYVIDRANIHAPERRNDRRVGGTPSNDPALLDEYLERVKAMYYRSRNHTCVIAYALGGEAGNGYNMYKAYQWLKSVEHARPVLCVDADGEWNSDL